ncbi:MAG: hypothetical protein U1F65_02625 [Verrucomicrobiota bacterium]
MMKQSQSLNTGADVPDFKELFALFDFCSREAFNKALNQRLPLMWS